MPASIHKLTIRREQADLFAEDAWKIFVQKLVRHVHLVFPTFFAPFAGDDEAMRQTLLPLVEQGRSYGIDFEYDLVRYVDIQLFYRYFAQELGDPALIQKKLAEKHLPGRYRVDRVFDYVEKRLADVAHGRAPKPFVE